MRLTEAKHSQLPASTSTQAFIEDPGGATAPSLEQGPVSGERHALLPFPFTSLPFLDLRHTVDGGPLNNSGVRVTTAVAVESPGLT